MILLLPIVFLAVSMQLWSRGTIVLGAVGLFRDDVSVQASDLLPKPAPLTPVAVTAPRPLPNSCVSVALQTQLGSPKSRAAPPTALAIVGGPFPLIPSETPGSPAVVPPLV
jgi:hypothetical protein